jgi:antitoxin component of RelBE/YafQ-DinJ toxin-antitoxin module
MQEGYQIIELKNRVSDVLTQMRIKVSDVLTLLGQRCADINHLCLRLKSGRAENLLDVLAKFTIRYFVDWIN